jgi:hypothetical protein
MFTVVLVSTSLVRSRLTDTQVLTLNGVSNVLNSGSLQLSLPSLCFQFVVRPFLVIRDVYIAERKADRGRDTKSGPDAFSV